jgi:hypothetical protein
MVQLMSVAVLFLTAPTAASAAAAEVFRGCSEGYCLDFCPGDLGAFCHGEGCAASGASCTWSECQRINGNWGNADISCGDI